MISRRALTYVLILLLWLMQAIGGSIGGLGVALSIAISIYFVAKPDYNTPIYILLLCFPFAGMINGLERDSFPEGLYIIRPYSFGGSVSYLLIGGVQIQPVLIFMITSFLVLLYDIFKGTAGIQKSTIFLSTTLIFIGSLSSFFGFESGNELWSISLRMSFLVFAVYWGFRWAKRYLNNSTTLYEYFLPCFRLMSIMLFLGLLGGHLVFIIFPFCVSALLFSILRKSPIDIIIFGLGAFTLLGYNKTFTQQSSMILVITLLSIWLFNKKGMWAIKFAPMILSFLVVGYVYQISDDQIYNSTQNLIARNEQDRALSSERFLDKLIGDRGPLWKSSLNQITNDTKIIAPSGSYLYLPVFLSDYDVLWSNGAHSGLFESFNQLGIIGGIIVFILVVGSAGRLINSLTSTKNLSDAIGTIGIVSILITAYLTGNYLIYDRVGPLIWMIVGMAFIRLNRMEISER